jgi:CRISPR/Cas system CSM-associated protein Csm3 (group 7 of RAMP superfamily)
MMRFRVALRVHFDGAFNIGSGAMGGSLAQRPMLTDWRGLPMVPASSLKGRLRHTCRQLARAMNQRTCDGPQAEAMCQPGEDERFCAICRLFGSPWLESPLTFTDLTLVEPAFLVGAQVAPSTSLRYGVGLSRRRRVAQDQLLYHTEVFLPGGTVTLEGEIRGSADEGDLGLLVAGLENVLTLGGSKTSGMGWCEIEFDLHRIEDSGGETPLSADELRQRWLSCIEE